jgi:hypothetical protein
VIPMLTVSAVRSAMKQFDATLRSSKAWQGWDQNSAYKYAIDE